MRAEIARRGLDIDVDSAGTGRWHIGEAPDPRAIAIAKDNGVDIGEQAARQVTRQDFGKFDHIVALDGPVLADLRAMVPADARAELSLFFDHLEGRKGEDVADPYYGGVEGFAVTWADVSTGAAALADKLQD